MGKCCRWRMKQGTEELCEGFIILISYGTVWFVEFEIVAYGVLCL